MTGLGAALLEFVAELRAAGVRISVAESIDAMRAVVAAGVERVPMREALAAALIKDEGDRPLFDELFVRRFAVPSRTAIGDRRGRRERAGVFGAAGGPNPSGTAAGVSVRAREQEAEPLAEPPRQPRDDAPHRPGARSVASPDTNEADGKRADHAAPSGGELDAAPQPEGVGASPDDAAGREDSPGIEAGRAAALRALERTPFGLYRDLEYDRARDALILLKRRFRLHLARRLRIAAAGKIDLRRTLRAAIQHGGALGDLRFRARRPRHLELLVLADLSGSMTYAAALMLELAAGAIGAFRRVRSLVYVDRLAEAGFERGRLIMTPALDLYARSDFGRVLGELTARRAELITRATVIVIMGDGRNNRRPARADLLRELSRSCRAIIWLNPEPPERWNTGDSAIGQYARAVTAMIPAGNLRELERGLKSVV